MSWFAVYETSTGALVSQGTVMADPLPEGLSFVDVGSRPIRHEWDSTTLTFQPSPERPPKVDRVSAFLNTPVIDNVLRKLDPAEVQAIADELRQLLGPYLYRHPEDSNQITKLS